MKTIKSKTEVVPATPALARSVDETIAPLIKLASDSVSLLSKPLPAFQSNGKEYSIPRFLFIGPKGGAQPIRVALFGAVHGDEPESAFVLVDFLLALEKLSTVARDYCLFVYPIVNPTGFEANTRATSQGINIPREIWKNTSFPEVQNLQSELWMHGFDGMVSFNTDAAVDELTISIGGPLFARHFLGSALTTAQDFLPQVVNSGLHALPKWKSLALGERHDLIRAAPGQTPRPFEIVITIPGQAPLFLQKAAVILLLKTVLTEYRKFIAFGANI